MRGESPKGRRCASQHPRSRVSPPQCPGRPGPGPHWQETWQEWADTNPVWGRAPLSSVLFAMKAVLRMSAVFVFRFVVTAPIKYPAGWYRGARSLPVPAFLCRSSGLWQSWLGLNTAEWKPILQSCLISSWSKYWYTFHHGGRGH